MPVVMVQHETGANSTTSESCPVCGDYGLIPRPTPTRPKAWGQCDCLIQKAQQYRHDMLVSRAGLNSYRKMKLESFKPITTKQDRLYESVMAQHGGVYIYGSKGNGKTHLAAGTVWRAISNGISAVIISVPKLLEAMAGKNREHMQDAVERIQYLVLDDIGMERTTDFGRNEELLFTIIDDRWRRFISGNGHTSFTSKYPLENHEQSLGKRIDSVIVSRISGMCDVFHNDGPDMRCKK